jgi:hypothetical protein
VATNETRPEANNIAHSDAPSGQSEATTTNSNPGTWADSQIGRRQPLPSNRACVSSGVLAALLDGFLLLKSRSSFSTSLIGALFVGVFVYGGMRFITGARRKIRPDHALPNQPTSSAASNQAKPAGASKGGWANPTTAQKLARRITRIMSNYGKRRPPRR